MAFSDLSEEEVALLTKMGITQAMLEPKEPKQRKEKDPTKAPVIVDLTLCSGEFELHCKCCGNTDKYFCDYVKRADDVGYTIIKVATPKHRVTKHHKSEVLSCSYCAELTGFMQPSLIQMIKNLRAYCRKGDSK
jgi:hypothetical protein